MKMHLLMPVVACMVLFMAACDSPGIDSPNTSIAASLTEEMISFDRMAAKHGKGYGCTIWKLSLDGSSVETYSGTYTPPPGLTDIVDGKMHVKYVLTAADGETIIRAALCTAPNSVTARNWLLGHLKLKPWGTVIGKLGDEPETDSCVPTIGPDGEPVCEMREIEVEGERTGPEPFPDMPGWELDEEEGGTGSGGSGDTGGHIEPHAPVELMTWDNDQHDGPDCTNPTRTWVHVVYCDPNKVSLSEDERDLVEQAADEFALNGCNSLANEMMSMYEAGRMFVYDNPDEPGEEGPWNYGAGITDSTGNAILIANWWLSEGRTAAQAHERGMYPPYTAVDAIQHEFLHTAGDGHLEGTASLMTPRQGECGGYFSRFGEGIDFTQPRTNWSNM